MTREMAQCPHCAEFIPIERFEEHLNLHRKYGTMQCSRKAQRPKRSQKAEAPGEVCVNEGREVYGAAESVKKTEPNPDAVAPLASQGLKTNRTESGERGDEIKAKIIDGELYVDGSDELQAAAHLLRQRDAEKTRFDAPQAPNDPALESLESFQDFLLYAAEKRLTSREMDVFCLRFGLLDGEWRTLQAVGDIVGVTRERISQIVNKSLRKIASTGSRQLNRKQWKEACAMTVAYVKDEIRHGQEGDLDRFIDFADKELPHLELTEATNLLGYFFGGKKGIKAYRRQVSHYMREAKRKKRERYKWWKQTAALNELLSYIIWPTESVNTDPDWLRTLEPRREISDAGIGHSGHWYSDKMQRLVGYESELERKFIEQLDSYKDVVFFLEQPMEVPYVVNGRARTYYPDILLVLGDGRGVVVEIKPCKGMAMRENWEKWSAMRAYCQAAGYGFLVTDGRKAIQQVSRLEIRSDVRQRVLDALEHGPLDWGQYQLVRDSCGIKTSELHALIIQERLWWQPRPFRLEKDAGR